MKPTIEAVLIVKNEEEMLARCLESLKGIDFITIVDTGSKDHTVEVAKKYTDRVYTDFEWCDDFAKARNHALSKATGDYILSIDADERLESLEPVRNAVEFAAEKDILAINCTLLQDIDGTNSSKGQSHSFPRLFKRDSRVWWEGAAHNHISVVPQLESKVKIYYGYSPAHKIDPDRTLRILLKSVQEKGNARETYYLAREYWYRNNYKECVKWITQYVEKSKFLAEKADAYLMMSRCYWLMNMSDEARNACVQALIINPHFKEACMFMVTLAGRGTGNPQWENNAIQWERMAATADNSNVLFVRPV